MSSTAPQAPRLGRYQLLRRLALGGSAEVLVGQIVDAAPTAPTVALKRLLPQFAQDPELIRMLTNEARLLGMFDHPNIVRLIDAETDPLTGQHYMAMELIDGLDLRALMRGTHERGQRVSPAIAARVMVGVLEGLSYVHQLRGADGKSMQVVHRDLSPQNIVVSMDGVPKLIDFGVVKADVNEGDTKTGQIKGSLGYMAPEQISGRTLDGRADIFAVGVCLYELITGVNPFQRNTALATFNAVLDEQPGPMSRWAPDCPPELEEAVRGALSKQREGRYRAASEMRAVLERVPGVADDRMVARIVRSLCEDPLAKTFVDPEAQTLDPTAFDRGARTLPLELAAQALTLAPAIEPLSPAHTLQSDIATQAPTLVPTIEPLSPIVTSGPVGAAAAVVVVWSPSLGSLDGDTIMDPPKSRDHVSASEHETASAAAVAMPRTLEPALLTTAGVTRLERPRATERPRDAGVDDALARAPTSTLLRDPPRRNLVAIVLSIVVVAIMIALFGVWRAKVHEAGAPIRVEPVQSR